MSFNENLVRELDLFVDESRQKYPPESSLRIDLHCHDHNSKVPDELLGRILKVPETWLPTAKLVNRLKSNGSGLITITNHNNARSCYDLLDQGLDVLVGAEFSCMVPDFDTGIHVLTYGFTPEQENILNRLRHNLYDFLIFTKEYNLPTIWAHPLYHYSSSGTPPLGFFDKMALVFERFEVINGQRETWQNLLVKRWVQSLTPQRIDELANQTGTDPAAYCRHPYLKSMSGGSDSHMGIFAGLTGTLLHLPDQHPGKPLSARALDAIRNGDMVPFGSAHNHERMMVAFLDYASQVVMYSKDPGLIRMLLHKGSARDKLLAFLITNAITELRRHKVTMSFIELTHEALTGTPPKAIKRLFTPKPYKPIFDKALKMAHSYNKEPEDSSVVYKRSLYEIYRLLGEILAKRLREKVSRIENQNSLKAHPVHQWIDMFEVPASLRYIFDSFGSDNETDDNQVDLTGFLDGLPFPFLASAVIVSAAFASTKVLYNARPLLNQFSAYIGSKGMPDRALWLVDLVKDENNLPADIMVDLQKIRRENQPIDLLVCSEHILPGDHLIVVKPLLDLPLPLEDPIKLKIPDILEVHELFHELEYTSLIASSEGPLGLIALYLKEAYTVNATFRSQRDWVDYARTHLDFDQANLDRLRRMLRAFYKGFDQVETISGSRYDWF